MCTVTWWRDATDESFGVWFNRDERRTRPASEPVRAQVSARGTAFLAARDAAAGGTWLLANERGLVVGVLNFYAAAERHPVTPARSRGLLPLEMADGSSVAAVAETMATLDCAAYAPFLLLACDAAAAGLWSWDGVELNVEDSPTAPVTTSSHRSAEICAWRRARYREVVAHPTPAALSAYHDDVAHPDPAFNVRMRRPDARTESVCRVTVSRGMVRFWHRREDPDSVAARDLHEVELPRR